MAYEKHFWAAQEPITKEKMQHIEDGIEQMSNPTDSQVTTAVNAWLNDHPGATSTVQLNSITRDKLVTEIAARIDHIDAQSNTLGIIPLMWESGGLYYSATSTETPTHGAGEEYISSELIRTKFISVASGEIYRFDWLIQEALNIYGFAGNTSTSLGSNERLSGTQGYVATRYDQQPLYYQVPEGVNYIRLQIRGNINNNKPIMIKVKDSVYAEELMKLTENQTGQLISEKAVQTNSIDCTQISINEDLNNYVIPGNYYAATTAIASSLQNLPMSPFNTKFRLFVFEMAGAGNPTQIMITEAAIPRIFKRYCAAGNWRAWTQLASINQVMEIVNADITADNKSNYFNDADNAPINSAYSISSTAEIANTPLGPGVASNNSTNYTDLRSIAGYQNGILYTYKSGVMTNQIFISTTKISNGNSDPTVLWYRSKWQSGIWSDWHAAGDQVALSASNIIIVNKMIAQYMDQNGNYTTINTGINNPEYMGDDPRIFNDFNNAPINKMYQIDLNCTEDLMANNPMPGNSSVLCTFGFGYASTHGRFQLCVGLNHPNAFAFVRYGYFQSSAVGFVWTPWAKMTDCSTIEQDIKTLKSKLQTETPISVTWQQGVINTNGALANSTTRIRSLMYTFNNGIKIVVPEGMQVSTRVYSMDGAYETWTAWSDGPIEITLTEPKQYRFCVRYSDPLDGEILPAAGADIVIYDIGYTDTTLSVEGKAADAKAVGDAVNATLGAKGRLTNGTDLNTIRASGFYLLGSGGGYVNAPNISYGFLTVKTINTITCQMVETPTEVYIRFYDSTSWRAWTNLTPQKESFGIKGRLVNESDLNTITESGVYQLGEDAGYRNAPSGLTYGLLTVKTINEIVHQNIETPTENFSRLCYWDSWGIWKRQ